MNSIFLIIHREFMERVSKKSFIIVTILMPLLMLLLSCLPALIMKFVEDETRTVLVVDDEAEGIGSSLMDNSTVRFLRGTEPLDSARTREDVDAVLFIPRGSLQNPSAIALYSNGPVAMDLVRDIEGQLSDGIEQRRIYAQQIDNLKEIMQSVQADVTLLTFRNDRAESEQTSSTLSFALGMALSFVLYMFLLIYGQMVMTSIIEEKNNRVLELVVTSVKPIQLMLGKIFGVASVALVQILIWMVLLCCISAFVLPATLPSGLMEEATASAAGTLQADSASYDVELLSVVNTLGSVGYVLNLLFVMLLFVITGFLFYAAIFAAVGSAVDNIQDASQLQTVIVVPIILALVLSMSVAGNPQSTLGIICSYIPFTSPMVMMARVPFGIPWWEVALSLLILVLSFIFTAWLAGKIYRVGIFMHGKKPSYKDLWKWSRQN